MLFREIVGNQWRKRRRFIKWEDKVDEFLKEGKFTPNFPFRDNLISTKLSYSNVKKQSKRQNVKKMCRNFQFEGDFDVGM